MNPETIDVAALRRVLMDQPEPWTTRAVALAVSVAFLAAVLNLVRRGRLREEYTPIWTVVAVGIMVLSVWSDALRALTHAVGAWAPSSTLFFFGELFLLVLCLNYAVRLSRLTLDVKLLAQELALLRADLGDRDRERRAGSGSSGSAVAGGPSALGPPP
jgi:NO-binding membrane sensor protein with MHYT domain